MWFVALTLVTSAIYLALNAWATYRGIQVIDLGKIVLVLMLLVSLGIVISGGVM